MSVQNTQFKQSKFKLRAIERLFTPFVVFLISLFLIFFANSQGCVSNEYFIPSISLCIPCPLACSTCTDSLVCLTCQSSATIIVTNSTKKCYCQKGKYYNPNTLNCESCSSVIPNCAKCSTGLVSPVCVTCANGFYLYTDTSCAACPLRCKTCSSATQCLTCLDPQFTLFNGDCICGTKCTACAAIQPGCIGCDTKNCKKCDIAFDIDKNSCIACPTDCMICTGGKTARCTQCYPGFFLDTNRDCQVCSSSFTDPFCTQCQKTQCTVCSPGYIIDLVTLTCIPDTVLTCPSTQIPVSTFCIPCASIIDPYCYTCNLSGCLSCVTGYIIDSTVNMCIKQPVCGDGDWVIGIEDCDDGNSVDGDGCSAICLVEIDYQCLEADKQATGESLCKYLKDFVVTLSHVIKQESANVAYFYFTFETSTFLLWTDTQLLKFLNPVSILDSDTGTGNSIPFDSAQISLYLVNGQFNFILAVSYSQKSIENGFIKLGMDPSQTALKQINTKPPQTPVYYLIDSRTNAVNLYSYSTDLYTLQNTINTLSAVLGYTSFIFLILGLISPVGKLIVVQSLAVIQLAYFSVLQFDKIPPTFIGFKNLAPSSGIDNINVVTQVEGQFLQKMYKTMGLDSNLLANYNLSFVLFFFIPFLIGLIGFLVCRFTSSKSPQYQETKESLLSPDETKRLKNIDINNHFSQNLRDAVFQRIMFEVSFYGIITTGYLTCISALSSILSPDIIIDIIGICGLSFMLLIWLAYTILYLKVHTEQLYLPPHYTATFQPQNTVILKGFADFRDVYQQISKHNFYYSYAIQKVYIVFILQRLIVSFLIVFFSDLFGYTSVVIAVIYIIFLIVLIIAHVRYQNKKIVSDRKSVFSYLYRNYVLRQSVNFITTIFIQLMYTAEAVTLQDTSVFEDTLSMNSITTKIIPIIIFSLLYLNLTFNIFLWILQIKNSQIVRKTIEMKKFFFSERNDLPYKYDTMKKTKKSNPTIETKQKFQTSQKVETKQKRKEYSTQKSAEEEENSIVDTMKIYAQKFIKSTPRNSPFLGFKEKQSKAKSMSIESVNEDSARKINIQMQEITVEKQKMINPPNSIQKKLPVQFD